MSRLVRARALGALLPAFVLCAASHAAPPKLSGNFQFDHVDFRSGDGSVRDVSDWRRQRLGLSLEVEPALALKAEYDAKSQAWTDVNLAWTTAAGVWRVGQFKQPIALDTLISDKHSLFMESAFAQVFGIDRRIGIDYAYAADTWSATVGVFGQDLRGRNAGRGVASRVVFAPPGDATRQLHLAFAAADERPDAENFSLRTRPETALGSLRLSGPGTIEQVHRVQRAGLEAAWRHEAWLLQAELARLRVAREDRNAIRADGGYVSLSRVLTGETHGYRQGVFTGIRPSRRWGAVEAALRHSRIEFSGELPDDGQSAWTAGLTWHLAADRRVMLNWIEARRHHRSEQQADTRVVEMRLQWVF